MAESRQQVVRTWNKTNGVNTFTMILDDPALAGSTLIAFTASGAIAQVRLTDASGTLFTKRVSAVNQLDIGLHEYVCSGGETTAHITLPSGPGNGENAVVVLTEYAGLGSFVAASSTGTGTPPTVDATTDYQLTAGAGATLPSGDGVVLGGWILDVGVSQAYPHPDNHWSQMEPSGVVISGVQQSTQDSATAGFSWGYGEADVDSGSYAAASQFTPTGARSGYALMAVYANAGAPIHDTTNPVVVENRRPGTRREKWFLNHTVGWNGTIAGYQDKVSYQPGETVHFKVDSDNGAHTIRLYRFGHYGHEEMGARLVATIAGTPAVQGAPAVDPTTGHTECAWTDTATWTIPADAPSGVYWYLLARDDAPAANLSSGHFVVTGAVTGKVAVVVPDATHQAYNIWGARSDNGLRGPGGTWTGRSVYQEGGDLGIPDFAHRAYAVSWDRPMATGKTQPNTYLYDGDYPVWHFLEAQGYDLVYVSDVMLDSDPTLLMDAALVVPIGHHEYMSQGMWDAYDNAIQAGVNVAWHSSNTALWHVRFTDGGRTMVCYKDNASGDDSPGFDNGTGLDPAGYTGTWRDGRPINPDPRPEQHLTGQMFVANGPSADPIQVAETVKGVPIWRNSAVVQALTTGQVYSPATLTYGYEGDFVDARFPQRENLVQLCPTVLDVPQGSNLQGTIYSTPYPDITVGWTLFQDDSGALVFNTGAWRGWEGCSRWARDGYGETVEEVDPEWQNAINAILYDLGARPVTVGPLRPQDPALADPANGAPTDVASAYGLATESTFMGWGMPV